MPYDEGLAERIRERIDGTPGLAEKKMFGGLAFLVNGHIAAAASKSGDMMIRCSKEDWEAYCAEPGAHPMKRGGKGMTGWVIIEIDAVSEDPALDAWVRRGRDHAASQPPK
jgi:hypothetical protein